jgi:ABC-type ATPase with predicted acetyltransferase domain
LYPLSKQLKTRINGDQEIVPPATDSEPPSNDAEALIDGRDLACSVIRRKTGSERSQIIGDAFGLDDEDEISFALISMPRLVIQRGQVVLISGGSGTGKTSLARYLTGLPLASGLNFSGALNRAKNVMTAELPNDLPELALIDQFDMTIGEALTILNSVGLSEARLYQMTPSSLSVGQRHRLQIALLMASGANCWVADDLASGLDDLNAAIAARALAKAARRIGAALLVTSSTPERIEKALVPDLSVAIRIGGTVVVSRRASSNSEATAGAGLSPEIILPNPDPQNRTPWAT